jgi:hypothetical protein
MSKVDNRFCLIADNGDKLYPYMKSQRSTGRYGFALNAPGEQDRHGSGKYTTSIEEVIRLVVNDGWSVRAKTTDKPTKQRGGSFGFRKRAIIRYEISDEFKSIVAGAKISPAKVHARSKAPSESLSNGVEPERQGADGPVDEKTIREIMTRRGQPEFRNQLLAVFEGKCCITKSSVVGVLEAAHIVPFAERPDYSITNGLLLRSDVHTLFDLNLLMVTPNGKVEVSHALLGTEYERYSGVIIANDLPDEMRENLRSRYEALNSATCS